MDPMVKRAMEEYERGVLIDEQDRKGYGYNRGIKRVNEKEIWVESEQESG